MARSRQALAPRRLHTKGPPQFSATFIHHRDLTMGSIYRKKITKPLPANAEIIEKGGQKIARWRDRNHNLRTAPLSTVVREVATG